MDHLLWVEINISLVCHRCHVPEGPDLNYKCALQKLEMGFEAHEIIAWLGSLPLKVRPGVPPFLLRAEDSWESTRA